ncbi:MAG TPA: hybrid sensor histidine kinase/response regulator [Lacunisphaera sp.]|nr:hybrid sensor histidine kinase/response regulator [Lacunisphaera sp.]
MKILVIDDQPDVRDLLHDLLTLNGHEVLLAVDGEDGVRRAVEQPEFIICDVDMPKLDGHGVLAAVRQMPGVRDVPFVFLTVRSHRHDQREGMTLGADDFITKPFTSAEILDAIAARTRQQRSLRERVQELAKHHQQQIHAQWSHELLTPLNAVLGILSLIESEAETIRPAELKELLAVLREGAERQERLARKLICYFQLEQLLHAPPSESLRPCAVGTVGEPAARQAAHDARREGDLSVAFEPGEVKVPEELLRAAVGEVAANAFGFSKAGDAVRVTGLVRGDRYRIEILDQGPGMTAEQSSRIGAFTQFDRRVREQQGLGLGLAIARSLARLAGGNLLFGSGAGGRGLLVTFDLPLRVAHE